ncbi:glucokinase [Litorilituus lipolyticus]|uniref:Glucokinase n=1 Tax=Litorilituus lipolyticus TaxID=2491017 RepID=A0A502KYP4_9GAMM|nr:glucokinase [Litorilituus lipolyticus]TPH15081.1 glucokinase [Litorilituus lipolyticus]
MKSNQPSALNLIADIGGTNIRIALADANAEQKFTHIETYRCADFTGLSEILALYISNQGFHDKTINACLAIACPTDQDIISMTNLPWQFSQKALKTELNLSSLSFINDYTAIAMAIPLLNEQQKVQIGTGKAKTGMPISVCGPGTGLGVANLVNINNQWHCISGEGGHVDFAPVSDEEIQILASLKKIKERVSYEQLLSGYGLEQIYTALVEIDQVDAPAKLSAQQISESAKNASCATCNKALDTFCKVLGSFAGNLALTSNSQGGVYIAGGIVPRFIDYVQNSQFRARFEYKGRLSNIPKSTPTFVITEPQPGLLGAAAYILQQQSQ